METATKIFRVIWMVLKVLFVILVILMAIFSIQTRKETRIVSTYLNICVQKGVCPTPAQLSAIKVEAPATAPVETAPAQE